jgi:hypothetical protein
MRLPCLTAPPEQLLYENLKQKSHFLSLRDQIIFMMQPKLRKEAELYITEQAASVGYKALILSNLQQSSNVTVQGGRRAIGQRAVR